jgi:hypothetical protein
MRHIRLILCITFIALTAIRGLPQQSTINSSGYLTFLCDGILYTADTTHARGYAIKQTGTAFISAANAENMVINLQWEKMTGPGTYFITAGNGKAEFTINHKTSLPKQPEDYVKVIISSVKQHGVFLLLKGTFEGKLHDKGGNPVKITDGKFETVYL